MKSTHPDRDALPAPGLPAASAARVKGTLLACVVEQARHEPAETRASLSEACRQLVDGVVLASVWYPLTILDELLTWLGRRRGPGVNRTLGANAAERDLKGVYRSFLRATDPAATLEALPVVWSLYHDSGGARVVRSAPERIEVTVRGFARPSRALCELTAGWLHEAVLRAGGQGTHVSESLCRLRHDDRCQYVVVWERAASWSRPAR